MNEVVLERFAPPQPTLLLTPEVVGAAPSRLFNQDERLAVLHVGCGIACRSKLLPVFQDDDWREIRLDIDPDVHPDLIASTTDMGVVPNGSVDAVYSAHNVEHLYPHEVPLALREMHRVLKATGFAVVKLPDLQQVAQHIAEGRLEDPLYMSSMGPIAPLDILYGHRSSLANGNLFMAHHTGFTGTTLGLALVQAGFAAVLMHRDLSNFCLTAVAFRSAPGAERVAEAQAQVLPAGDTAAVIYTAAS